MPISGLRLGPFLLDPRARIILRDGAPVFLQPLLFDLLHAFLLRPNELITKDELLKIGWTTHIASENSLTQAMSRLRAFLDPENPERFIQTVPRRGYRCVGPETEPGTPLSDADIDDALASHIALIDGRALIETLEDARIARALELFSRLVERDRENALFHVGLANACVLRFESTRADATPDVDAMRRAELHAREAWRRKPDSGETCATLGVVLGRVGNLRQAIAALRRSVELEPDVWQHHLRHAFGSWGDECLRAVRRTLDLWPALPAAHWRAAAVFIARNTLRLAEREIDAALAAASTGSSVVGRVPLVGVHWLKGLLCLLRDEMDEALRHFDAELALQPYGYLYSRECCASAWYAKGVCFMLRGDREAARAAFGEALARVPRHLMAHAGLAILGGEIDISDARFSGNTVDAACARAALLVANKDTAAAAAEIRAALETAPPGNAGWLLPIEPLLNVQADSSVWSPTLAVLRARAGVWLPPEGAT